MHKFTIKTLSHIAAGCTLGILLAVIFSAVHLTQHSNQLSKSWENFDNQAVQKISLLTELQSQIGFGGMIHNFKNYVLRKDPELLNEFHTTAKQALSVIKKYRTLTIKTTETSALKTAEDAIQSYISMASIAEKMVQNGASSVEIDKAVKINDVPTLIELSRLKAQILNNQLYSQQKVEKTIADQRKYITLTALIKSCAILFTLCFVFYVCYIRISKPLVQINNAMHAIAQNNLNINVPYKNSNDEIGKIAQSVFVFLSRTRELKIQEAQVQSYVKQLEAKQKVLEEEIKKSNEATIANQRKSEFLATMSHEIRTPMNGIIGTAELMRTSPLSPEHEEDVKTIIDSAESLLLLINEVLDFSKIEAGYISIEEKEFELENILNDVAQNLAPSVYKKDLELLFEVDKSLPKTLKGDSLRFKQILTNYINNAIKFTEQGYIHVNIQKNPNVNPLKGFQAIQIEVTDTGVGIDEQAQKYIFEKFCQADISTTRKYGGTGLGLSICYELAKLMHGTVGVRSKVGKGSTFWCSLILQETQSNSTEDNRQKILKNSEHILIIDPNPQSRKNIAKHFRSLNFKATLTATTEDALAILASNPNKFKYIAFSTKVKSKTMRQFPVNAFKIAQSEIKVIAITPPTSPSDVNDAYHKEKVDLIIQKPLLRHKVKDHLTQITDQKTHSNPQIKSLNKFKDLHALCVEDNPVNLSIITSMLKKMNIQVDQAVNGEEALEIINRNKYKYHIVFMDCQMPIMDGYTATRKIQTMIKKQKIKGLPVIALTANAMKGDQQKCLNAGMSDYIAKPIHMEELVGIIEKWAILETDENHEKNDMQSNYTQKENTSKKNGKTIH